MRKFQVGQKYRMSDWFTGGSIFYEVDSIKSETIRLKTKDVEPDGVFERYEEYPISHRENGDEYILFFTYCGEECAIYAVEVD